MELRRMTPGLELPVAVLDGRGCIVFANEGWLTSAGDGLLAGADHPVGCDYVAACERAASAGLGGAAEAATALRELVGARSKEATVEYRGRDTAERTFRIRARRTQHDGATGIALVHDNVTDAARARGALERRARYVRTMHELSSDLVVFLAPDRSVRWASASRARTTTCCATRAPPTWSGYAHDTRTGAGASSNRGDGR